MLIDIRKRLYGFVPPSVPVSDVFRQPTEVDLLLGQRPSDGGLPRTGLARYLDKNTPLDVKQQLEGIMSSSHAVHQFENEDDAFASIIDRHATVSELEEMINVKDNADGQ